MIQQKGTTTFPKHLKCISWSAREYAMSHIQVAQKTPENLEIHHPQCKISIYGMIFITTISHHLPVHVPDLPNT